MGDLGCAVDSQGIVAMLEWEIFECAVDYHVLSSYTDFQLQFEKFAIFIKAKNQQV